MAVGRIGVVAAMDWESAVFPAGRNANRNLLIETTGPGTAAAAGGARRALARGATVLLSWGSAGALGRAGPGDIVLPDRVCDAALVAFETDPVLSARLAAAFGTISPVHRGTLACAEAPVASVRAKQALAESSGAIAVDMESAAIARVAEASGIALVVVRVIVDRANRTVPAAAIAGMEGPQTRPGRVLAGLLAAPAETGGLIALGFAARRARRTLRACAVKLTDALQGD